MRDSTKRRREAVAELIARDGSYTMQQLRAFLAIDYGIEVTKETVRVDLRALGIAKRWIKVGRSEEPGPDQAG